MLELNNIHSYYGSSYILKGVSIKVEPGEVVCLIGRNGSGKTTTLKTIMGIVKSAKGSIKYKNEEISVLKTYQIARKGMGYVPEDRRIYPDFTISENLEIAQIKLKKTSKTGWNIEKVYEKFPALKMLGEKRLGSAMSGGEQQMLAIARTLMGNPEFILLDEPSEGLAPKIISDLLDSLSEIRKEGISILLSEQNMRFAQKISDKAYVIDGGKIYFEGTFEDLLKDKEIVGKHITL